MKLLYCIKCSDLFKLVRAEMRSCTCGKTRGRYLNKSDAEISGDAVSIAIGNGSLRDAIGRMRWWEAHRPESSRGDYKVFSSVTAWVRPNSGPGNPHTRRLAKKQNQNRTR